MSRRSRLRRITAAALGGLILVTLTLVGMAPASAEDGNGKLLLVLDSSGSMKEKAGDGKTKIEAAKTALNNVVDALPDQAQVGMRVYGATVFDRKDEGACQDTQLVVPIGTGNQAKLKAAIGKYKPYGETPIAYSLEQAAKDLGTEGQRTILLVSDGEETCVPDPCPVAQKIADAGIDLKIDVVGFNVSGKAERQLRCVADKGNGDYYDADDTEELEESLSRLSTRAFRPFRLGGTPITGSDEPATAPDLGPGSWLDKLPTEAEAVKYYRLKRTKAQSTFWIGASLQAPSSRTQLAMKLVLPEDLDETCGWAYPSALGGKHSRMLLSGVVSSHSKDKDCLAATEFLLHVGFTDFSDSLAGQKFQLRVYEEPPVSTRVGLPAEVDDPHWQSMAPRNPKTIQPGSSFADAPTITSGTYKVDVMPGEIQTFKVKADWGQRIQVLGQIAKLAKADEWVARGARRYSVGVLSPYGGPAKAIFGKGEPAGYQSIVSRQGNEVAVQTKEVRWANRDGSGDEQNNALAGEFYVTIQLDREAEDEPAFALPMTLTVGVIGTPNGAPQYANDAPPPAETPSPSATPSSEPPASESPEPPASQPASNPPASGNGQPGDGGSGEGTENDGRTGPPAGLTAALVTGAVVLVGGGTGLLVWLRRH
ncbi:vWA domain-containing protein [Microlunatus parietis]|uniref:Ca-activated chloride channel family protein n=1 Tax=Microlunatus parietis TaxID=682979 RepID=A0A7Y9I3J2_9ACTN|nr:VWA domain-containing protein [Microlunatus parietis]NYE69562.1 Ca-activated chloride channel family protein [Microlunatus parietis]